MKRCLASAFVFSSLLLSADAQSGPGARASEPGTNVHVDGFESGVTGLAVSPDGKYVVFRAQRLGLEELYALNVRGGPSRKLSPPFAAGRRGVIDHTITLDSRRVLFLGDQTGRYELYVVPMHGGEVVKIDRQESGSLLAFFPTHQLTLVGERVLFVDKPAGGTGGHLRVAPLDGGPAVQLSTLATVSAQTIRQSPDGQRVVFQTVGSATHTLWSASLDGGPAPIALAAVTSFFGPALCEVASATQVVFGSLTSSDLFSVPIDGHSPALRLNGAVTVSGSWQLSADRQSVLFLHFVAERTYDLYSVPVDGSAPPVRLSDSITGQLILQYPSSLSGEAGLVTNPLTTFVYELQGVPLDGSTTPELLSTPGENLLPHAGTRTWGPLALPLPDGASVLYAATGTSGETRLARVPLDGAADPLAIAELGSTGLITINTFTPFFGRAIDLDVDPSGASIVYRELDDASDTARMVSATLDGASQAIILTGPVPSGAAGPRHFATSFTTGRVFFSDDSLKPGVQELFDVPLDGSRAPRRRVSF